jgi:hypothetical protein
MYGLDQLNYILHLSTNLYVSRIPVTSRSTNQSRHLRVRTGDQVDP